MNYLRKLARSANRTRALRKHGVIMVHGYMKYYCQDCGYSVVMYLENGLEQAGKNRKPVPFGIRCPHCGGFHCYDASGLIPLPNERPLNANEHYFKNTSKYDCGIPVHPEGGKQ